MVRSLCRAALATLLRLYPRRYRERFAEELLATFEDQLDTILVHAARVQTATLRHGIRTAVGLVRSLIPAHFDERRRYYGITDEGMRVLRREAEWLEQLTNMAREKQVLEAHNP